MRVQRSPGPCGDAEKPIYVTSHLFNQVEDMSEVLARIGQEDPDAGERRGREGGAGEEPEDK
jgi:hypothetical protein